MVKITKQLVSAGIQEDVTYNGTNPINSITVHQTGNTDRGANAQMHANLQSNGNSRAASWHIQVDDHEAIQSFPYTAKTWHAGDYTGNQESISVELAINSDGDYNKTLENGAQVVRYLMDKFNLDISDVYRHYDWSGKWCPAQIMNSKDGTSWKDFKNMVKTGSKASGSTAKPLTSKSIETLANEVIKGSHGTGEERKRNLGDKYEAVQDRVNEIMYGKDSGSKSIDELAQEVLDGEHGSGQARKDNLGSNYSKVQKRVNEMLGFNSTTKSNREVAMDVINGKYGSGSTRRTKLAEAGYNYDAVQAEVNDIIRNGEGNVGNGRSISVGDKVTVPAGKLYGQGNSKTAVNSTPRTGYVETVNHGWINPYRITKSRYGSDYLGFYRP